MPEALAGPRILDDAARAALQHTLRESRPQLCEALSEARGQAQAIDIIQRHYRGVAASMARTHPGRTQALNEWLKVQPLRPDEERRACDGVSLRRS
jgi:hypothetical protein